MKLKKKLLIFSTFISFLFVMFLILPTNTSNAASSKIDISKGYDYYLTLPNYIYEYTGKAIKPSATLGKSDGQGHIIPLKKGTDYKVSYSNNVKIGIGSAQVTVTGIGKYKGTKTSVFTICKYSIEKVTVSAIPDQAYNGKIIKPKIKSIKYKGKTLKEGTDYTISYPSYDKATPMGPTYLSIIGIGDYYGNRIIPFNVVPPTATNVKATLKNNGIKISWKKPSIDIDGYEIERKTSTTKKYKLLATVDKAKTSYIDTTPETTGKTYYYRIRTYKIINGTKYYSCYSNVPKVIFTKTMDLTITSKNNSALLKWSIANGADGYQIYRSTSKKGTYKRIKTLINSKKTSYTDKNIKAYTTYYYKIRCYSNTSSGKVYGSFSDIKTKTPLAKANIKKINYTGKTVKLSWDKISTVKGYVIYRSTSENGRYRKITTVSSKKTSYTDKALTQGRVYYYKIKAYKKKSNKNIYGDYSDRKQQLNKINLVPDKEFKNSGYSSYYKDYEKLIKKYTNSSMPTYTKVKTMYKYLVNHLYHKDGFNCKNFAGTFAGMCRVLGLDAYCATGETRASGGGYTAHTWTIVNINGTEYIFDASLERHATDRTKKISYTYFFKTYSELPGVYKFQGYDNYWPFFMIGNYILE